MDTGATNNQTVKQSLEEIRSGLDAGVDLQQQFELVLPIIPFLIQYKSALGSRIDLEAAWNDLLDRIRYKGKAKLIS